ncbi:MAG: hypothetical protein AAF602_15540 [Myxococcota bacterium]
MSEPNRSGLKNDAVRLALLGWLACLGLDGLIGILFGVGSPLAPLAFLTGLLAAAAAVATPRVPARVVGPAVLFLGWTALGAMPLSLWLFGSGALLKVVGSLQAGLAGALAAVVVNDDWRGRPAFDVRRTVGLLAAGLVGLPLLCALYVYASLALVLDTGTGGYLVLTPRGLDSVERQFVREDTTVHLVGMIHLGNAAGYDSLKKRFETLDDAILLAEGVSDREGLLAPGDGYGKVAKRLGLTEQPPPSAFGIEVRHADMDVRDFSPATRDFLQSALGAWNSDAPALPILGLIDEHGTDAKMQALLDSIYADLIVARNAVVLEAIEDASADHTAIVVPWGAGHMPGIEAGLRERGFTPSGSPVRRPLVGR